MGPSLLSQTIRRLERHLGVSLFDRSTRSVALTAAGDSFLRHARTVLAQIDLAESAAWARGDEVYGRVSVSFSGALNFATVPRLVSAVHERHPHVELLLVARLATAQSVTRLVHGEVDLAFVGLPVDTALVRSRAILDEPLDVVLPAGHPFAKRRRVWLTAVAEEPFVTMPSYPGSALSEVTFQAFAQHGIRPHIAQEVNDPYLLLSMVAEGIGAAIVPTGMRPILPAGVVPLELSGTDLRLVSGLAWNRAPSVRRSAPCSRWPRPRCRPLPPSAGRLCPEATQSVS
jgi:DNA-binding transcriptional LysR family regulator